MANKKSSITAQIKVAGLNSFKSDLATAGKSAVDLGTRLQTIKPLSFEGEGQRARKAMAMREEHHRASIRVIERNEKTHQARMAAFGPKYAASYQAMQGRGAGGRAGGQGDARTGGGLSGGGNLAQGYNFVQDLVQGGPMAVANNIPWLVTAVAQAWKSPTVVAAAAAVGAGIAAAASVGLAGKLGYDVFTEEDKAFERSNKNRNESKKKWDKINLEKDKKSARDKALVVGTIEGERQAEISQGTQRKIGEIKGEGGNRAVELQHQLRQARIDAIIDPEEKAKAAAEEEKNQIDISVKAAKSKADQIMRIADLELKSATRKEKEIKDELALQQSTAKTPDEINRRIQLEAALVHVLKRKAEAEKMSYDALGGSQSANQKEQDAIVEKKIIDTKTDGQLKEIQNQKFFEKAQAAANLYAEKSAEQQSLDADAKVEKEKELARVKTRESMAMEEKKSRMSPRQLAKQEAKERIKGSTEELKAQGFTNDQAASMAKGQEPIRDRKQIDSERAAAGLRPRIRGAGYGDETKEAGGLGSAKFTGLEGLAAMQPAVKDRKRIQGVGAKKKETQQETQQEGGSWQTLVNAMMQVKAAVEKIAPNASERGKPSSSASR